MMLQPYVRSMMDECSRGLIQPKLMVNSHCLAVAEDFIDR